MTCSQNHSIARLGCAQKTALPAPGNNMTTHNRPICGPRRNRRQRRARACGTADQHGRKDTTDRRPRIGARKWPLQAVAHRAPLSRQSCALEMMLTGSCFCNLRPTRSPGAHAPTDTRRPFQIPHPSRLPPKGKTDTAERIHNSHPRPAISVRLSATFSSVMRRVTGIHADDDTF